MNLTARVSYGMFKIAIASGAVLSSAILAPGGARAAALAPRGEVSAVAAGTGQGAPPEDAWTAEYQGEVSLLYAAGNTSALTFALGAQGRWEGGGWNMKLRGRSARTQTRTVTRSAVGSPDSFELFENATSELTGENYALAGVTERQLGGQVTARLNIGWERNTFSGFNNRLTNALGFGGAIFESGWAALRGNAAATLTWQDDIVEDPDRPASFVGARVGVELMSQLTETTSFEMTLTADENLSDPADLRVDADQSLLVNINGILQLKTNLRLLFDNRPALAQVPLRDRAGDDTGETVIVSLMKLDTALTLALVANF